MKHDRLRASAMIALFTTVLPLSGYALSEQDASQEEANQRIPMEDVQRFSNALSLIKKYYVKQKRKILF